MISIQKDAAKTLTFIYKKYSTHKDYIFVLKDEDIQKENTWDFMRIQRAFRFLKQEDLITSHTPHDYQIVVSGITPDGIKTVENSDKFRDIFNQELNLEFNWED